MKKLPREHFEKEAERTVPHLSPEEREAWISKCHREHPGIKEPHEYQAELPKPTPAPPPPPAPVSTGPSGKELYAQWLQESLASRSVDIPLWVWRALVLLALIFLCVVRAHGQGQAPLTGQRRTDPVVGPVVIRFANTSPSGNACTFGSPIQYYQGIQYTCANGSTYASVAGGGSGCTLGGVSSQAVVYNNAGNCAGIGFGTAGQILTSQGAGTPPAMADPIVSFNYTTLLNAVAATGTQTGSAVRIPLLSAYGSLAIQGASITGSPSGCQIALEVQTNVGTPLSSAVATQAFTPANSYQSFAITPSAGFGGADQMVAVYSCSVYPGAGTITAVWEPAHVEAIPFALPTGANTIGAVTQASGPWTQNLTQVGGSSLALGQTTMSASVPVAIASNQSAVPVSGTVTANAGTGTFNIQSNASVNLAQVNGVALGSPSNYGTSPGAVSVPGVNAFITNTPTVTANAGSGTFTVSGTVTANQGTNPWTDSGALSNNGAAASSNRLGTLPGIAQTSYNNGTASTQGRDVALNVGTDGLLWTAALPSMRPASYTASSKFAASSTTDNSCMPGNATNTVLVTELRISGIQTTAGILNAEIVKRSAADTGGTSANMTVVPDDSNYAAGSSQPVTFTSTGPSAGAAVGDIDNVEVGFMAAATASPNDIVIENWHQKPIVLRGTAQNICVALGGAVTGGNMSLTWKWIETTTLTP